MNSFQGAGNLIARTRQLTPSAVEQARTGGYPAREEYPVNNSAPPKSCPRCRGLMIIEDDWYGKFGTCIACGYVHENQIADPAEILEEERLAAGKQRRRQPSHGKLRL